MKKTMNQISIIFLLLFTYIFRSLNAEIIDNYHLKDKNIYIDIKDKTDDLYFRKINLDTEAFLSGDQIRAFYIADTFFTEYVVPDGQKKCYIKKTNDCFYLSNRNYSFARNDTHYIIRISLRHINKFHLVVEGRLEASEISKDCDEAVKNKELTIYEQYNVCLRDIDLYFDGGTYEIHVNRINFEVDDLLAYKTGLKEVAVRRPLNHLFKNKKKNGKND